MFIMLLPSAVEVDDWLFAVGDVGDSLFAVETFLSVEAAVGLAKKSFFLFLFLFNFSMAAMCFWPLACELSADVSIVVDNAIGF